MKKIKYQIISELGIHARPAGLLVKLVEEYKCKIIIGKGEKEVDAKRIIGIMSLGVRQGDIINVTFDGEDEIIAATTVEKFLKENF